MDDEGSIRKRMDMRQTQGGNTMQEQLKSDRWTRLVVPLIVTVLAVVTFGACNSTSHPQAKAATTTTAGNTGGGLGSTGSTGTTGSTGNTGNSGSGSVQAWGATARSDLTTLATDLKQAETDADAGDLNATVTDCIGVQTDVTALRDDGPIPSASLEADWATGLADLSAGAMDCINGIQNNDTGQVQQAITEFDDAASSITTAANAVH
jgi:hypothetical protein